MAHDIVLLLFGEKWLGAVPAIPWLCAAAAVATLFKLTSHTVTSVGRPFAALPPLIVVIAGKLLAIYLIYDGSLSSFAMALVMGELLSAPVYIYINKILLGVDLKQWANDVIRIFFAVLVAGASTAAVLHYISNDLSGFLRLLVTFPVTIFASALCYQALHMPLAAEIRNILSKLLSKGKK
jgi:O-antigen/teichoic acid export membrane protein